MRKLLVLSLVAVMAFSAIGLAQELGTREHPIRWLFVPSQEPAYLENIAKQIAADISEMTGLYFDVRVMQDYQAFIEEFVAAEGDVMGAPTTQQYITIADRTDFQVIPRLGSMRSGFPEFDTVNWAL